MPTFLIADDHALFRDGLSEALTRHFAAAQVLIASTGAETMNCLNARNDIDLVLLDLSLPDSNGLGMLRELLRQFPTLAVAVLSGDDRHDVMRRALEIGALGYITKATPADIALNAIGLVLAGGVYAPPELLRSAPLSAARPSSELLTASQRKVLRAVVDGKSNKLIALELGLSEATVKAHVSAIFKALGASNRTQAARTATDLGLFA